MPNAMINFWGILPMRMWHMVAGLSAIEGLMVLQNLGGQRAFDGISHEAHLGGLAMGYLFPRFFPFINRWLH